MTKNLYARCAAALLTASALALLAPSPAQAEWHHGWRGPHWRGGVWTGGYYAPPPVVYTNPYYPAYAPPPVVYAPGVSVNLPGIHVGIR